MLNYLYHFFGRSKWKAEENGNMTEEENLLNTLCELQEKDPGCLITLGKTSEGNLKYLFVQTSRMKENVHRYGKVIFAGSYL